MGEEAMAGMFKKMLGVQETKSLDSCCGAVSVTPEDETTVEEETVQQAEQQVDACACGPAPEPERESVTHR
jgi:hypothetical protein